VALVSTREFLHIVMHASWITHVARGSVYWTMVSIAVSGFRLAITSNLRILPVFGSAALAVSPRLGHLHFYVDDQSWPTVDSSGETVVLVGLKAGPHKVRLELADATHKPIPGASSLVEFTVPDPKGQRD